ncbi:transposable element Tc3 transposase [Trichonephila clavipes]|uniref:Transposable element Tc3 transposase n=1 Tax=Trichonephila clavipes TaxID=2585209 RepID=A0A8X6RD24_TRICX|nr:transposable element Tc3 transposase [Trichonephila clavipes]
MGYRGESGPMEPPPCMCHRFWVDCNTLKKLEVARTLDKSAHPCLILAGYGERQVPVTTKRNTIGRHRYGGAGWLVWGGIILGSKTDLHVQSVTMTRHIYQDVILEQHVRLFRVSMGAEFLFMDDNARPHRANIVDECLQSEAITCIDWPAYSPDMNPIEHVWDKLGRRIAARQSPPTCLSQLRRALLDEWCNIHHDQIDNLILSIPKRCYHSSCYKTFTALKKKFFLADDNKEIPLQSTSSSAIEQPSTSANSSIIDDTMVQDSILNDVNIPKTDEVVEKILTSQ